MAIGSKEFREYCDKNNIPNSHRIWANCLWKEAQKQVFEMKQGDPPLNTPVLATIEHWYTKGKRYAILKRVKESDCNWRLTDDNSELSYDWNVVGWTILPKM